MTSRCTWTAVESPIGVASTVVDLTADVPRVLRQGAVSIDRIRDVIGEVELPEPMPRLPAPLSDRGKRASARINSMRVM